MSTLIVRPCGCEYNTRGGWLKTCRLHDAAPALLAALQDMIKCGGSKPSAWAAAEAAIAKATGG